MHPRIAHILRALVGAALLAPALPAQSPGVVSLSLDSVVALTMRDSYRVRQLRLEIERTRSLLRAQRAGLRSRVYMTVSAPELEMVSERKWNSTLQRDELVRENSRLWQMDFSVKQPVIVFGYPTNGNLSLNNRVYRFSQVGDHDEITYYNRYFVRYEQPLFQPNELRNDIETAELDLQRAELQFQNDAVQILDDVADDYYRLVELAAEERIYGDLAAEVERALDAGRQRAARGGARKSDVDQAQVALANARERRLRSRSEYRLASARLKNRLRLPEADSVAVPLAMEVPDARVDLGKALEYASTLRPRLRMLAIREREEELRLSNARGNNSFEMNLELTYGREMQDEVFRQVLDDPSNSYTVRLQGRIPIWDAGQRKAQLEARRYSVEKARLSTEQARTEIVSEVTNTVQALEESRQRAMGMRANLTLARELSTGALEQYREGEIGMAELLQALQRQADTNENLMEAYLAYRDAALDLQEMTFYDFEREAPVLEHFHPRAAAWR